VIKYRLLFENYYVFSFLLDCRLIFDSLYIHWSVFITFFIRIMSSKLSEKIKTRSFKYKIRFLFNFVCLSSNRAFLFFLFLESIKMKNTTCCGQPRCNRPKDFLNNIVGYEARRNAMAFYIFNHLSYLSLVIESKFSL
jgi:hypothetical protein